MTQPVWVPITVSSESSGSLELFVLSDAWRTPEGYRGMYTALTQQKLADSMHASLLTQKLADEIYLQSKHKLRPVTLSSGPEMMTESHAIEHSRQLDAQLKDLNAHPNDLVSNVGKHWILAERLVKLPNKAVNYGWYMSHVRKVISTPRNLTGIQGPTAGHFRGHFDYSQTARLVSLECSLNGQTHHLHEIADNPNTRHLITYEPTMNFKRY